MMPLGERIPFLVALADLDVEALRVGRPGDVPNLVHDLRRYLNDEAGEIVPESLDRLRSAIEIARDLVTAVAAKRSKDFAFGAGKLRFDASGGWPVEYRDMPSLRDLVLLVAVEDLRTLSAYKNVKQCPECATVFYARRSDQIYCGRRCANAVAVRSYKKNQKKGEAK